MPEPTKTGETKPPKPHWWSKHVPAVVIGAVFAIGGAGSAPWWWHTLPWDHHDSRTPTVVGFSRGCSPYRVFAQNRWMPYGAVRRVAPDVLAVQDGGFGPNQVVPVDGWIHSSVAYPTNRPPFNNDVWFHLADGSGWVDFAAVREVVTQEDPTGLSADGGLPAPTPPACEGAVQ